jgi:hypothetical protein
MVAIHTFPAPLADQVQYVLPCPQVGHHKGDVQENVISNMMKGCSLLELAGMYPEVCMVARYRGRDCMAWWHVTANHGIDYDVHQSQSIVNGVKIWRPMLRHPKACDWYYDAA